MTNNEAIAAFTAKKPIMCRCRHVHARYIRITAVMYRYIDGKIKMVLELLDKNKNCTILVEPEYCEVAK